MDFTALQVGHSEQPIMPWNLFIGSRVQHQMAYFPSKDHLIQMSLMRYAKDTAGPIVHVLCYFANRLYDAIAIGTAQNQRLKNILMYWNASPSRFYGREETGSIGVLKKVKYLTSQHCIDEGTGQMVINHLVQSRGIQKAKPFEKTDCCNSMEATERQNSLIIDDVRREGADGKV